MHLVCTLVMGCNLAIHFIYLGFRMMVIGKENHAHLVLMA